MYACACVILFFIEMFVMRMIDVALFDIGMIL